MTGETQHVYTVGDTDTGPKDPDKDFGCEGCGEKDGRGLGGLDKSPFPGPKDKESHSQREAVIRPQQVGKIDFKSLHCKPKFSNDGSWGEVQGSLSSPSPGKGRARERSRRSGKGERGHPHQLYRLSIAGTRPSPTIGIAYPQQKVTPPKKPEANPSPVAGSYRFHVPNVPQREAELRQEDLGFGCCFPDATTGRTSANYTSQPAPPHGPKGQPPAAGIPLKSPGTNGQLHYLEFQANGADSWPSPEKSFTGASYGISLQKPGSFPEGGKASAHGLGALPCQYPFQLLQDSGKEPYSSEAGSQEYLEVGISTGQLVHGAFAFHSSSREWQEETPSGGSYESVSPEGRLYGLSALPPPPFLHPVPASHHGPLPCCKGRSEHPANPHGALSSSSGAIDQNPSTFQENQAVFPSSLHSPGLPKPAVGKRQASAKDNGPSPRLLVQGSPLRRTVPPNSLSQVHFQSKAYCSSPAGSASAGSVPFETSIPTTAPTHPRFVQAWEGATKAFSPVDQNSAPYSNPLGNQFSFECQPSPEQRQHRQKNARMPWQQIHLAPAMSGQNRLELLRQITSQKLPFPLSTSEWQGGGKGQKGPPMSNSPGYHSKKLVSGESLGVQRGEPNSTGTFSFENGKDPGSPACESRSKALFYNMSQAGPPPPPSRSSSGLALVLPPSALVAASPCESPLPSPVPNPPCGSTCSSLSPMSSSPLNPSFEDSQISGALTPSPFFQHPCHSKESNKTFHPSDVLSSGSLHYHPSDSIKSFHFPPDALKDDNLLKCAPASPFHKSGIEVAKGCSDGLDGEQPPPPYSSHHLLASSLSSASLDQLDVLLTCKQCDQNYSNLSSFLQHRQFCSSHPAPLAEGKDAPRAAEGRKALPQEPLTKPPSLGLSPDPQAHLLVLNKSDDFLLDGESKSEGKEDALKGGLFNGLTTSSLPITASDLDIDDAKLDSLITEALNGLGYQSDNPEIDSSFIDVFADEELTGVKAAGSGMSHKAKEALALESKSKQAAAEEKAAGQPKAGCFYEDGHPGAEQAKRGAGKQHLHKGRVAQELAAKEPNARAAGAERTARLRAGRKSSVPPATTSSESTSSQKHPRKLSQEPPMKSEAESGITTKSSRPSRFSTKDMKKRKPRSGTWSKELIHKIVQQKNKLHRLQVKSSKQAQVPQVTEGLVPAPKEGRFQEYDYISDSDDDGTECSKLRGQKKRGTGFIRRTKSSFGKKRSGRPEKAKEKDPAWRYSQKRDGQKREAQAHRGVPSQEDAEKEDCVARVRRQSSQSSTDSNHSSSVPGEIMVTSPPHADGAGSGSEKGGSQRRRSSGSPARAPRTPLSLPEDRSPKNSQKSKEDFSRGSRRFGSAKPLLAGSRTCPNTQLEVAGMDCVEEEPVLQPQERQLPSLATIGRSPIRLSCKEGTEEPKGTAKHRAEAGEPILENQDSPELTMVNQRHQFAPFTSNGLKYHAEELIAPSHGSDEASPGHVSAAYSEAGIKYLKAHGLCEGRKDCPVLVAPYGRDAVGMMLTAKAPDPYVSSDNMFFSPRSLPGHYNDNLFSKPPALSSSHMDDMYLCQDDIKGSSFEQKHASISPYATETPQGKVSSPLSFDSSSIFGDLPVAEFDPPLYESVSTSKDSYVPTFACSGNPPSKPLPFEQSYPPFVPEKGWSLMEEVAPMLPEDMTQFQSLSVEKPLAKKFPEEGPVPTSQLSLPLPDRITDYNVTFTNNISDDELEIKRLVTELESQLQTSKLDNEAPTDLQKPEQHVAAHLRGQVAELFPPLPVEQETGQEKGLFLAEELGSSSLCIGERLEGEKPTITSSRRDYERLREPWPCPVELGSLETGTSTAAPQAMDHFCSKDSGEQLQGAAAADESDPEKMENGSSSKSLPGSHTPDQAEAPIYTDPMTKSPSVVTDSVFPKILEAAEATKDPLPSLPCQHDAESFPVPGKADESFTDVAELEKLDAYLPNHKPQLGTPTLDLAFSPHIKEISDTEERPLSKPKSPQMTKSTMDFKGDDGGSALVEETEERKSPTTSPDPGLGDKASKQKVLFFDILSLPEESDHSSQEMLASQERAANPLQQLQLFVARTVKSNEEELLMPCFPMLLAPGHPSATTRVQLEQKEENGGALEGENGTHCPARGEENIPVEGNAENIPAPAKEVVLFSSGCEQLESFGGTGSSRAKPSSLAKPELQSNVRELQHLANEPAEQNDINTGTDGVSREHNDLSPLKNTAVTPLPGQGEKADPLLEEEEEEKNKATLAFKSPEQSCISHSLLEEETPGSAATERLERKPVGQEVQPLCSAPVSPTSSPRPSKEDLHQDHHLVLEARAGTVSAKDPREGDGKKSSLNGCHYTGDSPASLLLPTNSSHPKHLQSSGAEGGEVPSFSTQLSDENKHGTSLVNSSSSFVMKKCPPEVNSHHVHHPTMSPGDQGTWKREPPFPPSLPHCGAMPMEVVKDSHHHQHLPDGILGNYGPPEREGLVRPCTLLHADGLVDSALEMEGPQKPYGKDCSIPCSPPFNQKGVGKEVPKSTGAVLSSSHIQETQACTNTDVVVNSIPAETQDYPTQPTTDLLPIREREAKLDEEDELEICSDGGNKHQSEPEALSNGCVVQPAAVIRGLKRTGDLGPAELNGHEFSEAAEVRLGLSKPTESRGKSLKGEKTKSHRDGEAGSCVLGSMGQGEDNMPNCPLNPSQSEIKEKKPNGLLVTCDICSATFRSKPGLTRHKAVKHQVKNGGVPQPSKTPLSALIPADRTSKAAQKVPRRSLKTSIKDKTCSSPVPTTNTDHVPKKICPDLEKEPSTQMQEVVSRVLSDLSVISFEMSQELHRTRVLQRVMKIKGPCLETRGAGEVAAGKLDSGRQARKGEKGRRSQSKDPGEVNGNSEKLNRKVRRRKAKVFPSRNEPDGPCELEKAGPPPAVLPSLPRTMESLHEAGGCISTEEQNRSKSSQYPQKAKQSPCAAELAEDLGNRMGSSKEMVSKELVASTVTCPGEVEDPNGVEGLQACKKSASGFVKQVEKGLGKVGKEQHCGAGGTEEMDAVTKDRPMAESGAGNQSDAPWGSMVPAKESLPLETLDSETTQKIAGQGALQTTPGTSPPPAEPKHWLTTDLPPGREHCVERVAISDLQSLFDDDSTFSQLFPRDDQSVRRKCTRVYGKRSKKPKPVTEVDQRATGDVDLFTIRLASDLSKTSSFCVTREDPCEYETISVNDALMLNMCHSSTGKSGDAPAPSGSKSIALRLDCEKTDQGKEDIDLEDNMLTFLCQNSQVDNIPSLNIWENLEKEGESLSADDMFEPLMDLEDEHSLREVSSEPPDLVEESYGDTANKDSGSPEFHTIDIEMLNAKLKMRDMCFFSPCEDLSGHGEDNAGSFKPKPGQHSKHRSKLEDGKLGKNRSEMTIKTKDKQYKCKVCFQWFLTLGELDFHKLSHNPSPPPTCYMCVQRKFSSREQLRDHLKEKHAKNKAGLWACGMCLKEISDVWMYNEHLREHATQFARKGQAQKSVMGLPACFGEDNAAVTHFLNTIMYRKPSRSSRHTDPSCRQGGSRESKSPKELPLEQEAKVMKDPLESNVKVKPPASSSSKASASPSPEHVAKSDGTPKSVPMHPDCKDPSRDCHHCGKQFPKPFKLQRHLVVHSLQKIYLCHKCPMFYQETKELRNHLSQEHGIVEEQEIKHTTLYACELCADVMHVIKKSFICSMCNYTFSKKEQYDRHMEKHLAGSNKTFKFRGVMRPGVAFREGKEKVKEDSSLWEGVPPSKKRKVAHHSSSLPHRSPVHVDHTGDLQLVEAASPNLQASGDSFPTAPDDQGTPQPSLKTEDLVGDFSDLLAEMEKSQFAGLSPPRCLSPSLPQAATSSPELGHVAALSMEELEKGAFDGKPLPFLDSPEFTVDLAGSACNQATDQKLSPPHLTKKRGYADAQKRTSVGNKDEHIAGVLENPSAAVDGIPFLQLAKKVSGLPSLQTEAPPAKEIQRWGSPSASNTSSWEGAPKALSPEAAHHPLPLKDKTASPTLNRAAKDLVLQKKTSGSQPSNEAGPSTGSPDGSNEEGHQLISGKDKVAKDPKENSTNAKDQGGNPSKSTSHQPRGEVASNTVRHSHVEPSKATSKLHPRRRKEHKSLSHRSSPGSRENMEGDGKKKKARISCPGRSESTGELKHAGWSKAEASALSPGRRETQCNKLVPRGKAGTQLKKMVLDTYNQKKGEIHHANGDVKRRKAILGKSLHQVLAKGPAPSPHGSLQSPRASRGAKPAGSGSYRTAESQNNLLSQLFGQKLTSFKIPLRRDTSE
ncbi:zinc finger protein 469 [Apus apus]|uniref:zinc finger protein 469 n=1 Tax=Apus apus TaxID=8895 RepID=UPI0021F853BC|nr:zinc finger protein 469 [Apus apus]